MSSAGSAPVTAPRRRAALLWARDVAAAAAVLVLIGVFLVQPFRVEGASMEPLLRGGERIIVSKASYRFAEVDRGDVVVLRSPEGRTVVKRVVGMPGDVVHVADGVVVVDDTSSAAGGEPEALALGPRQYYVLGDNREVSIDSRRFGPVDRRDIRGRVVLRYWPLASAGALNE